MVRSIEPQAGAVGAVVTIRGRFPDGTSLRFGNVDVSPTKSDRNSIMFSVPAVQRGSHAIVIRAGGADVAAGQFRVEGPAGDAGGDPTRHKVRWDRSGWVMLGEQLVLGKRDRDVIAVGKREGSFTKLMVVVEDSDLEMDSMQVVFGNGERFDPPMKHFFREEDRTRAIDLPGDRRGIQRIELRYGNVRGGGNARVQVWAREGAPPAREPGAGAPPPGAGGQWYGRGMPLVTDFWPREGAAGTKVTIQGRRFTPELQIVFGEQVVAPSRSDATQLTFVVPRHRGAAPIVLRRSGRRDLAVGTFEVSGRDGTRERERWRSERHRVAERWWSERQRKLAVSVAQREEAMRAEEAQLAREREARRKERRVALRGRWEQRLLAQEDVRAELALHGERTARLDRMQRLAEAGTYGGLVVRIRLLVDYEDARHQQRMTDLKAAYANR